MNKLTDKVAIITGAAQGLGETYAKSLATEGAKLTVSNLHESSRVVAEINASGGTAAGPVDDFSNEDSCPKNLPIAVCCD